MYCWSCRTVLYGTEKRTIPKADLFACLQPGTSLYCTVYTVQSIQKRATSHQIISGGGCTFLDDYLYHTIHHPPMHRVRLLYSAYDILYRTVRIFKQQIVECVCDTILSIVHTEQYSISICSSQCLCSTVQYSTTGGRYIHTAGHHLEEVKKSKGGTVECIVLYCTVCRKLSRVCNDSFDTAQQ